MRKSFWHYERTYLMERLIQSFELEIVQSLILFAPRRIGKTEFLEYDLKPALEGKNYHAIYFSFFTDSDDIVRDFVNFLRQQLKKSIFDKLNIKELNFSWCKVSIEKWQPEEWTIIQLLTVLGMQIEKENRSKLILLLDEVQELQYSPDGNRFISGLRTALDKNKEYISVIFTGSSQEGLRKMFNEKKAPFFHYGMNIEMERFDKSFTDFLADRYEERVKVTLDKDKMYEIFCKLDKVTEYIRHIINQLVIEPELSLEEAYQNYIDSLFDAEKLEKLWGSFSDVEKGVYLWIKQGESALYTDQLRKFIKTQYGIEFVTNNQIQYAVRKLLQKEFISYGNEHESTYTLNNTMLTQWLNQYTFHKFE